MCHVVILLDWGFSCLSSSRANWAAPENAPSSSCLATFMPRGGQGAEKESDKFTIVSKINGMFWSQSGYISLKSPPRASANILDC